MGPRTKRSTRRTMRKKLTSVEKQQRRDQRRFKSDVRTLFVNSGFTHAPTRDEEFTFEGRVGEIDAVFLLDNVFVIAEETTLASSHIPDHLRKKAEFFEHLVADPARLVSFLATIFPPIQKHLSTNSIDVRECQVRFVYCTRHDVDSDYEDRYADQCSLMAHASLQYFLRLSRTIHRSARFELFKFLGIELADIVGPKRVELHSYQALLLPEVPSGFPAGHKLVSFLIDPQTLIELAYVLRADSWRDQDALYQRLLERAKIAAMRDYLATEQRVFVNNIIVTLPADTELDKHGPEKKGKGLDSIEIVELTIPRKFNAIGIIDGQHRVFAYHEGDDGNEAKIAKLRGKQHLLVTGIVYPPGMQALRARKFEATLFLEINDKQKRVRGDLKQSIERIIKPYSAIAVAKAVIERLAASGPLGGKLEVHFFDSGKIKTTSIVSYGLRHIVDVQQEHSLFRLWPGPGKNKVKQQKGEAELGAYIMFAANRLNLLLAGFKANVSDELWTTDRKVSRALSATTINGLIFCMRALIENSGVGDNFEYYRDRFASMKIDFRAGTFPYKSSHWRDLGTTLYERCFSK